MGTTYTGEVPVPKNIVRQWAKKGVTEVTIHFPVSVADLVCAGGWENFNEQVDDITGVHLTNLRYGFADTANDRSIGCWYAEMFVSGTFTPEYQPRLTKEG